MSIFDSLEESGITQEDLEKAASARLFAEAAAAEGIDLNELSEDQAEELYDFWANGGEEKTAADEDADAFFEAAASQGIDLNELSEDQVGELYEFWANGGEEKTAADEDADAFFEAAASQGIDLDELTEDQVGELYEFWANGSEEKTASAEEMLADAAVKEASAKLAEAEYIGRYMARVYAGELDKIAAEGDTTPSKSMMDRLKGAGSAVHGAAGTVGEKASFGRLTGGKAKALGYGLATAGTGGLAYGGKKLHGHYKSKHSSEKNSSIDDLIEERALEMLLEAEIEVEAEKLAGFRDTAGHIGEKAKDVLSAGRARRAYNATAANSYGGAEVAPEFADAFKSLRRTEGLKGLAETGGAYGGLALAGYGGVKGAKKMFGKKDSEKQSSIDDIIEERALEMLLEAEIEAEAEKVAGDYIGGMAEDSRSAQKSKAARKSLMMAHDEREQLLHDAHVGHASAARKKRLGSTIIGGVVGGATGRALGHEFGRGAAIGAAAGAGIANLNKRLQEKLHHERAMDPAAIRAEMATKVNTPRRLRQEHKAIANLVAAREGRGSGGGLLNISMRKGSTDNIRREAGTGEKNSSIDDLIELRALELLEEAQFEQDFDQDLDEAALELLAANGY